LRALNKKQKKLLDDYFEEHTEEIGMSFEMKDLPYELYLELERINDFEALYSEVTNYIGD